jgi:hypothetical protein
VRGRSGTGSPHRARRTIRNTASGPSSRAV